MISAASLTTASLTAPARSRILGQGGQVRHDQREIAECPGRKHAIDTSGVLVEAEPPGSGVPFQGAYHPLTVGV